MLRRQQHGALAGKSGFQYNNNATFPEGSGFGNLHRSDQWRAARPHGQFNVFEKYENVVYQYDILGGRALTASCGAETLLAVEAPLHA